MRSLGPALTLAITLSCPFFVSARSWTEAATRKQKTARDRFRYKFQGEDDWMRVWSNVDADDIVKDNNESHPANGNGNNGNGDAARQPLSPHPTSKPTLRPTHAPSLRPTTLRPTLRPTKAPSTPAPVAPTTSPTEASLCPSGYFPYEVHMYDRWGDGWEGTMLTISSTFGYEESFRGTLRSGHKTVQGFCLSASKCHQVSIQGLSTWNAEIYWEIYATKVDGTLVKVAYGEDVGSASSPGRNSVGGGGCTFDPKGGTSGAFPGCFNTCRDPNDVPVQSLPDSGGGWERAPEVVTRKPNVKPTPYVPPETRPLGYFNHDEDDIEYGPSAWGDVDTSGNLWETSFDNIDPSNQCGINKNMQSPIVLPFEGTASCQARRQLRSRSRRFSTCDGEAGVFEITPTRLRVRFGRGYEPSVVVPEGGNSINAAYMEVAVPSLHRFTNEDGTLQEYHAEYTLVYPWDNKGRIVAVSVLIDAISGVEDNQMFQMLLDGWSDVNTCSHAFKMDGANQRERIMVSEVDELHILHSDTSSTMLEQRTRARGLQCDFDVFHKSLVPSIYFHSYYGSLPEPPCTGNTNWKIIEKPMVISVRQLQQMNKLLSQGPCKNDPSAKDLNGRVRPVQSGAGRAIERCGTRNYWLDCNNNCRCEEELCPRDFLGQ